MRTARVSEPVERPRRTLPKTRIFSTLFFFFFHKFDSTYLMIESVCRRNASVALPFSALSLLYPTRVR